jgi:hypothetical protein
MNTNYEKHNIAKVIFENNLLEFKSEDIYRLISKNKWVSYYECATIEDNLRKLLADGKIHVKYVSQGSKTVAIYKSLKAVRNERIDDLLK